MNGCEISPKLSAATPKTDGKIPIMAERQFVVSGQWALVSDGLQWILYRHRKSVTAPWAAVSFVRSTKDILARCMREKGCSQDDMAVLLEGMPPPTTSG